MRMAKADVQKLDVESIDWLKALGVAIQRAVKACDWSNKEAAAIVDVDDAEFGKWLNGTRRPQFDRLFAVPALRAALVIAFAKLAADDGVEVTTHITVRRTAS